MKNYFGTEFLQLNVNNRSRREPNSPSLDRIDNTKGYVPGNVWVISWRANDLKRNATLEELKLLVAALEELGTK
jgi:hypothetical protein